MLPVQPVVPLVSCAAVVLAWGLVAHNSGAGWVQAVGDVLGGVLVVGLAGPALACWRGRVAVLDAPTDATAGLPVEVTVRANARVRVRPRHPSGPESFVGPCHAAGTAPGSITLVPERRGVHERILVEVASAAPFGLLWWRKTVAVELARPLFVGPRLGPAASSPPGAHDRLGGLRAGRPAPVGATRAVRPYRAGDRRRFVHWPATAHTGDLMVREMEAPHAEPVTVEVRLPADTEAAERLAERALGTVVRLVDDGAPVVLVTTEDDGRRVAAVGDRRSAQRRLARAVSEPDTSGALSVAPVRRGHARFLARAVRGVRGWAP